ncbi:Eco57I restriction-modification methylase domain-containing protein [Thermodesulfobacteriota bacterium]
MTIYYRNEYLFSEIYLQEITQVEEDPAVKATLASLKEYRDYADTSNLPAWNETFVHEILNALKFGVHKLDSNIALLNQFGSDEIVTICFSLLPSENLNSTLMGQNWSETIIRNLKENSLKWGILTSGDLWRIYYTEEPTPYENYLEIDLKEIMDAEDVQQYQIFNKFMKAGNFVSNKDGNCQFDLFKKESHERINYIEEELKNALKQKEEGGKGILSNICMGYVDYLRKNEVPDFLDERLRDNIYSSAMLYMFRLLFLFYAKARGLLKESNQELFFAVLKAAQKAQEKGRLGKDDFSLWDKLRELYSNIDLTYNGGLFNPTENEFVEEKRLTNRYLAPVIYFMTFYKDKAGNQVPISYRDMGVRHLGSLYEGLLEHKLFIAGEDTEVKITKTEIKFIPASKGGKIVDGKFIPKGKVYFGNDKGMRKASGSYYTPEYVVDYIVQNTVGRMLEEMGEEFLNKNKDTIDSLQTAINKKEMSSFIDLLNINIEDFINSKVMNLSVLDPASGSGHFLVNATNLISNFLTVFHNSFKIVSDVDTSTSRWRRRVVENCIYGVDLNPLAVELAKLSLWILSMAKDQPLSFLDHHLKCGNSLVGAKLSEIGLYPLKISRGSKGELQLGLFEKDQNFRTAVENAIKKYQQIEDSETKELGDINGKKEWLSEVNEILKPYMAICDFHTSVYFGEKITEEEYEKYIFSFSKDFSWNGNNFFHWELEYPDIMLKQGGFKAIVTNPPYQTGRDWEDTIFSDKLKTYLTGIFKTANYQLDYYPLFYEISANLTSYNSRFGLITPKLMMLQKTNEPCRRFLFDNSNIVQIVDTQRIFEEAYVDTAIIICEKPKDKECFGSHVAILDPKSNIEKRLEQLHNLNFVKKHLSPFSEWKKSARLEFRYFINEPASKFLDKLRVNSNLLGDLFQITSGVKPYQVGKGIPKQTREIVNQKPFHSDNEIINNPRKHLRASQIQQGWYDWEGEYISYGKWLAEPKEDWCFTPNKIIIRAVIYRTGHMSLIVDPEGFVVPNTAFVCIPKINLSLTELKSLATYLLSDVAAFLNKNLTANALKDDFPAVIISDLNNFLVPKCIQNNKDLAMLYEALNAAVIKSSFSSFKNNIMRKGDKNQQDICNIGAEINKKVFFLLDLNEHEIREIELCLRLAQ